MTGIDLTPANDAARDAIWRHATRDVAGSIDRPTADRLAVRAVRAATPLIETAVREQIARQIEALDDEPLLQRLVAISPSAQSTVEWAAATARGQS